MPVRTWHARAHPTRALLTQDRRWWPCTDRWAPSPKSLANALLEGVQCRRPAAARGSCWSRFRAHLRNANLTEADVARNLPAAASAANATALDYSRAVGAFRHGGDLVRRLFFPWTLPYCAGEHFDGGWGWGWSEQSDDLQSLLVRGVAGFAHGARHPRCVLSAEALRALELPELRQYVRVCASASGFDLAGHSVPFMQLLLFLREWPTAQWTFVRFERLFALHDADVETALAKVFGLRPAAGAAQLVPRASCRFRSRRGRSRLQSAGSSSLLPAAAAGAARDASAHLQGRPWPEFDLHGSSQALAEHTEHAAASMDGAGGDHAAREARSEAHTLEHPMPSDSSLRPAVSRAAALLNPWYAEILKLARAQPNATLFL